MKKLLLTAASLVVLSLPAAAQSVQFGGALGLGQTGAVAFGAGTSNSAAGVGSLGGGASAAAWSSSSESGVGARGYTGVNSVGQLESGGQVGTFQNNSGAGFAATTPGFNFAGGAGTTTFTGLGVGGGQNVGIFAGFGASVTP